VHGASAEDVQVDVLDGLAAVGAGVDDDAMAVWNVLLSERGSGVEEVAEEFGGNCGDVGEVLFGDDEEVGWGLGVDVGEGEGVVVLVEGLDRDGALGDFAEEAVGHG
jgi:hypothetical protein